MHRGLPAILGLCLGLFLLAATPAWSGTAAAADIPTVPFLRIETGMHGAAINGIAVDEADQQIVTVSDDKTLRLWSETTGELLNTLRAPIGPGPEGGLYAAALSPSGKTIVAGGYTGITWDGSASIYLYNRKAGTWLGRIGLGAGTDAINHLAFSPDGRFIAVATNDRRGLRIVDTRALKINIVDSDYGDAIEWVDFAPDGRLVTTSLDGKVRLYDAGFKRIATWQDKAGAKPLAAAFNKTGAVIAVGFLDAAKVVLLNGRNLTQPAELDGAKGQPGAISLVAWSADSAHVYGAGTYGNDSGEKFVRIWPLARLDAAVDLPVSDDTVTAVAALKDGSVAFASAEPAWGVIGPHGKMTFRHDRLYADFRDGAGAFQVSPDGSVVDFGFAQGGKHLARFDVLAGTMTLDPPARADLKPPATRDGASSLTDWRNTTKPRLDGHYLSLDPNEEARSAAVKGDWAVLGTDYFLRGYKGHDAAWRIAVPAPVWVVNISADGRFAVAGLGDGTIRWYRLSDGAEILNLFAEPDGTHWVLWTPEGFFDHGKGGDTLIGYQLNQVDKGQLKGSAFVRVEQLYSLFYRRDLVVMKFRGNGGDEIKAQLAKIGDVRAVLGRGLPPDIELTEYCFDTKCHEVAPAQELRGARGRLQPLDAAGPEVTVHFDVIDRDGGIGHIEVRNKGATEDAAGGTRSVKGATHSEERVVKLQPGLNLVVLSAFNAANEIETNPKERPALVLRYDPKVVRKPVMRLLAVGIDQYTGKDVPKLANAANDAKGVAAIMNDDDKHDVYSKVDAIVLTDAEATLANINKSFAALASRTQPDDLVFVFLAGHGVALGGKYYYIPVDLPDTQEASIKKFALTYEDLALRLSKFPTTRAMVVLDTCYSGAFAVGDSIAQQSRDKTVGNQIGHATGRFILAGSSSQQEALDGIDGHGVFTEVLLKGLAGAADQKDAGNHDGVVSIYELGQYAKAQVPTLSKQIAQGYDQKPNWYFIGDDMFNVRDDN
ncbi:MAG TPA: caspase family protein [Stellaceae bacterium]|nr:caspase family protein [Stellaceae bacterium]